MREREVGVCDGTDCVCVCVCFGADTDKNLLPPAVSATSKPCLTARSYQGFMASLYFMRIIHSP